MNKTIALVVAGLIFSLVAIVHLLRLINQWEIIIGSQVIPMSLSVFGLILAVILALWMFIAAVKD